jgi:hypothetical protein
MTREQLAAALRKADAAGNAEDARRLAGAIRQLDAGAAAKPAQSMSQPAAMPSAPLSYGPDLGRVKEWYDGGYKDRSDVPDPLAQKNAPIPPPPPLWEAPVNVAKALDSDLDKQLRNTFGRRIDGVGPRTPGPTKAPISEQQIRSQTLQANTAKPSDGYLLKGEGFDQARSAVGGVIEDLTDPLRVNENARTIVGAPLQVGQGLGQGVQAMGNNAMAVGTDALNSGLNLADPKRDQFGRPRVDLFDRNALLDEGGLLSSGAGVIPRFAGQFAAARVPLGMASKGGGIGNEIAKDAVAMAGTTDYQTPRLSDTIPSDVPVIGAVADQFRSREGEPAISAIMKNVGEDLSISALANAILGTAGAASNAMTRQAPTPTNAGAQVARPRAPLPDLDPRAAQDIRSIMARDGAEGAEVTGRANTAPSKSMFSSASQYSVSTQDSGAFDVNLNRMPDGGAVIIHDKGTIPVAPEFAKGKSDEELLAYYFEPLGFQGATKGSASASTAQQAPTPPRTATAPPVPPTPPSAPAATAASPQPGPAGQVPPAGLLTPIPQNEAVAAFNVLPPKTREAMLRALQSSGMDRNNSIGSRIWRTITGQYRNSTEAMDAIRAIGQMPEDRQVMFALELMKNNGGDLETILPAMGRKWATEGAQKDQIIGGVDRGREIMDQNVRSQINAQGEYVTEIAERNFGPGVVPAKEALDVEKAALAKQYDGLLNPQRKRYGRLRNPDKLAAIDQAYKDIVTYLKRPDVINEMPDWVKLKVMQRASEDMRKLDFTPEEMGIILKDDGAVLAPLFEASGPLQWSQKMWDHLVDQYPAQAAHILQSAYREAADGLLSGVSRTQADVTNAQYLMRLRGESGEGGLLDMLERAIPGKGGKVDAEGGYNWTRRNFGDNRSAERAFSILERFKTAANSEGDVAAIIKELEDLPARHREAAEQQVTSIIRQELGRKIDSAKLSELGDPNRPTTPNLTALSSQNFLNALEDVFGVRGKELADGIRLARASTDTLTNLHPKYNSRTTINSEDVAKAGSRYEDPAGIDGGVVDRSVQGLSGAATVSAFLAPQYTAAIAGLAGGKAIYNAWKKGKRLNNDERNQLIDYLFRVRKEGDSAAQSPRPFNPGGVAARAASNAVVGAGIGYGASNGDPNAIAAGALTGAGVGAARKIARGRSTLIKPPLPPRGNTRTGRSMPPAGPAVGGPNAPRPLPGQQSNSPAAVGGGLLGATIAGTGTYAGTGGDEDAALTAAILGGAGGAALGGGAAKLMDKGGKPLPPRNAKPKPAFDQRFMKEAQRIVSYNGGVDKALKAQQYVIDQLKNSKAPNAQDRLNRAVSIQYAIRRMADRSNRELDEIAATAWKRDPATVGLGTQDYLAYINAKHPPATPNQTPPYFIAASTLKRAGGDRQAAAAELADYAAYLRQNKAAPEVVENADRAAKAVADVDPMFFDDDAFNARMKREITAGGEAAVAPARGAADALPGERPIRRGPPGVKPPQKRAGGKPPPKGPGTVSRMVAGGAAGGLAGSLGGDASAQEDLTAEMAKAEGQISAVEQEIAALKKAKADFDKITDPFKKQQFLKDRGLYPGTIDGNIKGATTEGINAWDRQNAAALAKAEADKAAGRKALDDLRKQDAYRQIQKEQNPFFDAVRELGPSGAALLGGVAATVLRMRGVGKSKQAVKVIEKDINDLLTNGPVKGLVKKGGAANQPRNRAVNMNQFYRRGGAPDNKLPFNYGPQGWKPNAKAAKPGSLYSRKTVEKMDDVGSSLLRPNDIKVIGSGLFESAAVTPFVIDAEKELKNAQDDVANGNESIEALRRVERAKTNLAMFQALQRAGLGVAAGGAISAAYRYKLPRPDIRGAEDEVTAISDFLKSKAPPKPPRAPRLQGPPATPPVAGPQSQLLLPAPLPPRNVQKPKPKKP